MCLCYSCSLPADGSVTILKSTMIHRGGGLPKGAAAGDHRVIAFCSVQYPLSSFHCLQLPPVCNVLLLFESPLPLFFLLLLLHI